MNDLNVPIETVVFEIVSEAARNTKLQRPNGQKLNKTWMEELSAAFEKHYGPRGGCVFCGDGEEPDAREFLYDLMVCQKPEKDAKSPQLGRRRQWDIKKLGRPEWQVESELHASSKEIGRDFNKLLIGGARYKLMICGARGGTRRSATHTLEMNRFFCDLMEDFEDSAMFVAYLTPWKARSRAGTRYLWDEVSSPLEELWVFKSRRFEPLYSSNGD